MRLFELHSWSNENRIATIFMGNAIKKKNQDSASLSTIIVISVFALIGLGILLAILLALFEMDVIPWFLFILVSFILCMTAAFALTTISCVCFSLLPFWHHLHNLFTRDKDQKPRLFVEIDANPGKNKKSEIPRILSMIVIFAFMVAAMNVFAFFMDFHSYFLSDGKGIVVEKTYRSMLVLDNGEKVSIPVDDYSLFSDLKHIELGDHIEKERGLLIFFVNGKIYFNDRMFWKQQLHSSFFTLLIVALSIGLLIATILKIVYPDELISLDDDLLPDFRKGKGSDERDDNSLEVHITDSASSSVIFDPRNMDMSDLGEHLIFNVDTPRSVPRSIFCLFMFVPSGMIATAALFITPFYVALIIFLVMYSLLIWMVLRSGVNAMIIYTKGLFLDRGAWIFRRMQQICFDEIKGFKIEQGKGCDHSSIQLELTESKTITLWEDLVEKDAEELAEKIQDALKSMLPEVEASRLAPKNEDASLGSYRVFGQQLLIAGIIFSLLPLFGLFAGSMGTVEPPRVILKFSMLWFLLFGVAPVICAWRMYKEDRSAVVLSLLLVPIISAWLISAFIYSTQILFLPWLGVCMVVVLLFASVIGIRGWSALPATDKNGRRVPMFRLLYIPVLLVAVFASYGLSRFEYIKGEMFEAVRGGNVNQVRSLLSSPFASPSLRGERRTTLLHITVESGAIETLEILLIAGVDPNLSSQNVDFPIHLAAKRNNLAMVRMLLSHGADATAKNFHGKTILGIAACSKYLELAELALGNGVKANSADSDGVTPLHDAAESGDERIAELLIKRGADVNAKDRYGNTPLIAAARKGEKKMVAFLIKNGAKVDENLLKFIDRH